MPLMRIFFYLFHFLACRRCIYCLLLCAFSAVIFIPDAVAQTEGKKIETVKRVKKKDNRKLLKKRKPKKESAEDAAPQRNSSKPAKVKDNIGKAVPRGKESTQEIDPSRKDQDRPYNPETQYQGNVKPKAKPSNSYNATRYQGDIKLKNDKNNGNNSHAAATHQGDLKRQKTEPNSYAASTYQGDLKQKKGKPNSYAASTYQGDIKLSDTKYSGNNKTKNNVNSYSASTYSGGIKQRSQKSQANYFKKLSAKAHAYEGDVKIKRSSRKNTHPSIAYLEGKSKNSLAQKEKLRKRKIWWSRKDKNSDQPDNLKRKNKKPKYDSRESEIWYY